MNAKAKLAAAFAVGAMLAAPFTIPQAADRLNSVQTASAAETSGLFRDVWNYWTRGPKAPTVNNLEHYGEECGNVRELADGNKTGFWVNATYNCHPGSTKDWCPYCAHQQCRYFDVNKDHYVSLTNSQGKTVKDEKKCGKKAKAKLKAKWKTGKSKFKVSWGYCSSHYSELGKNHTSPALNETRQLNEL